MTGRIIIAGAGGQGIMLLGKILAEAAMSEDKHVTLLPSYGAEVRGGTAHCMVVISHEKIGSPYITVADILIAMNNPSLEKFTHKIKNNGLLIINSSLASIKGPVSQQIICQPFTDIAVKLGNKKVANMVALGCLIAKENTVGLKTVIKVISRIAPKGKEGLIKINEQALREGAKLK